MDVHLKASVVVEAELDGRKRAMLGNRLSKQPPHAPEHPKALNPREKIAGELKSPPKP